MGSPAKLMTSQMLQKAMARSVGGFSNSVAGDLALVADVNFAIRKRREIPRFAADLHANQFFVTIRICFQNEKLAGVCYDGEFVADSNGGGDLFAEAALRPFCFAIGSIDADVIAIRPVA